MARDRKRLDLVLDFIRCELMAGLPFPGASRIATYMGISDSAIYSLLDKLIIEGHVQRVLGSSKHSRSKYTWMLTKQPKPTLKLKRSSINTPEPRIPPA